MVICLLIRVIDPLVILTGLMLTCEACRDFTSSVEGFLDSSAQISTQISDSTLKAYKKMNLFQAKMESIID